MCSMFKELFACPHLELEVIYSLSSILKSSFDLFLFMLYKCQNNLYARVEATNGELRNFSDSDHRSTLQDVMKTQEDS